MKIKGLFQAWNEGFRSRDTMKKWKLLNPDEYVEIIPFWNFCMTSDFLS